MPPKTTTQIIEAYNIAKCPPQQQMIEDIHRSNNPCDKCMWDKEICHKEWFSKEEVEDLINRFEDCVRECCKKGLATELILITAIPKIRKESKE